MIDYASRLAGRGPLHCQCNINNVSPPNSTAGVDLHWRSNIKRVNNEYLRVVVFAVVVVVGEDVKDIPDAGGSCKGLCLLALGHAHTSGS